MARTATRRKQQDRNPFDSIREAILDSPDSISEESLARYEYLYTSTYDYRKKNVNLDDGSIIPKYLKNIMLSMNRVFNYSRHPKNIIVKGSSGCGKTHFLQTWAKVQDSLPRRKDRALDVRICIYAAPNNDASFMTIDDWKTLKIIASTEQELGIQSVIITDNLSLAASIMQNCPEVQVVAECQSTMVPEFLSHIPHQSYARIEMVDLDDALPKWSEFFSYLRTAQDAAFKDSRHDGLSGEMVDVFIKAYHKERFDGDTIKASDEVDISIGEALDILEGAHARLIESPLRKPVDARSMRKFARDVAKEPGNYRIALGEEDDDDNMDYLDALLGLNSPNEADPAKAKKPLAYKDVGTLADRLKNHVVNQDEAIDQVVNAIKVDAAGLSTGTRPVGVFLFAGPSGVGKTELARQLANELYTKPAKFVRLDMSEYSEAHTVSNLYGSPRGYVGSDQGGTLTNAVMEDPQAVILMDEVEKAHPKVWDSMLQVFDAGRMTDSRGKVVDFSKCVIIMTSNLGNDKVIRTSSGFATADPLQLAETENRNRLEFTTDAIKKYFRVELINRLDGIILFNKLRREDLVSILEMQMGVLGESIRRSHPSLELDPKLNNKTVEWLLDKAESEQSGARDLQRTVQKFITLPLAEWLLSGDGSKYDSKMPVKASDPDIVSVDYDGAVASFQVTEGGRRAI